MKKFIVIFAILCMFLVGCSSDLKHIDGNSANYVKAYVDPETGVNYLVYKSGYQGGIMVRYNADGSIMVTEKEGGR